jgi:hypothetical protein
MQVDKFHHTFIFSDSGFAEEAVPVISLVGIDNALVIELDRPGCSFVGDSRGYVADTLNAKFGGKLRHIRIPNNSDQAFLTAMLKGVAMKYLDFQAEL